MATEIDKLLIRIEADLSSVRRQLNTLDKQVQQKTQSVGKGLNRIASVAKVALGAVIVQQAARAGMAMINMAASVEEMQSKSEAVFGSFVGQVRKELSAFGQEVGWSAFELEGMASSIQDTFVPMGFARGEAAKLSVELTKLATDVASFNNASDTETMKAFQSALVGNHETVRRFGIVITEASLKQELLNMGINKSVNEITNQEKVQARLNLIMKGTTDAQGDALKTAGSFTNRMKALGAALNNLVVTAISPFLDKMAEFIAMITRGVQVLQSFLNAIIGVDIDKITDLAEAEEMLAQAAADLTIAEANVNKVLAEQARVTELANAGNDRAAEALDGIAFSLERKERVAEIAAGSVLKLSEKVEELREAAKKGKEGLGEFGDETKRVIDKFTKTQEIMVQTGAAISDSLADMVVEGKLSLNSFADIFKNTMKQIIASYIQTQMIVPFLRGIGVPVTVDMGRVAFDKTMANSGLAGGGSISTPRVVGERGAELFIPHSAGVIKNNMDTKNMLGGSPVVVNQSINVDAGVAQTVRAEILTMMPMFKEQAMSAVLDARRRGGSFAATFGG